MPLVVTTVAELRSAVAAARKAGCRIGVVPTMGALHVGHLSLVEQCRKTCDFVVVTIFVNPTQFGPHEDFDRYPRQLATDLALLAPLGVELVFAPSTNEVYPHGPQTTVDVHGVTAPLEGASRPGHFTGVATIVLKLFNMVLADEAFFGHKDYQQACVIRQMVRDLNVPVEVVVCPTVREPDGLALSSRNVYLSPTERQAALAISRSLWAAAAKVSQGERSTATLLQAMHALLAAEPLVELQYVTIVDPDTLLPVEQVDGLAIALIACRVGKTRLIDNIRLESAAK